MNIMKKYSILIPGLFLGMAFLGHSQGRFQRTQQDAIFTSMPGEMVYVHQNTALLFAGETLYYKVYCRNQETGMPSEISKIAYVALLGKDGRLVFHHKIRLINGIGEGDFFVPADVPTDSYKLIGYTQWMKNGNGAQVFSTDIELVNPYQPVPEVYLPERLSDSLQADSLNPAIPAMTNSVSPTASFSPMGANHLRIGLAQNTVGKRTAIPLAIETLTEEATGGNYSLSVRRVSDIPHPGIVGAIPPVRGRAGDGSAGNTTGTRLILPELRGEMLSGTVLDPDTGTPVANTPMALSMTGDDFIFDMARTDSQGRYYFNLDQQYANTEGVIQVIHDIRKAYSITPDATEPPVPEDLSFYRFTLMEDYAKDIRTRSIQNQIENAYARIKSDTILSPAEQLPFYRNFQERYLLDDYTRFNTIEETLVEIVDHVWVSKNANGEPMFQVRPFDGYLDGIGIAPMVFMDGLFIQHHEDILSFPAKRIKAIYFSRDRYQMGANVFQGVLAFETIASDFEENFFRDYLVKNDLFKPQPEKAYYHEEYSGQEKKERIPDFRRQLLWEPTLNIKTGPNNISCFSSDISGLYEVRLEGYTSSGNPVSLRTTFNIE
jgi:hypothetical protein